MGSIVRYHRLMEQITVMMETNEGETEIVLPSSWAICDYCEGDGTLALGGIALTQSDMETWDIDERADYFAGHYDTPCEACGGSGKVREVNEDRCDPTLLALYHAEQEALADMRRTQWMEYQMGA